jgi:hypothetical protein
MERPSKKINLPFLREVYIRSYVAYGAGYATFGYDQW